MGVLHQGEGLFGFFGEFYFHERNLKGKTTMKNLKFREAVHYFLLFHF